MFTSERLSVALSSSENEYERFATPKPDATAADRAGVPLFANPSVSLKMAKPRDYNKEYAATHGTVKGKKDREARNAARAKMVKKHGKAAMKGKEVDHKNHNPRDNRASNLRVVSKKVNRTKQPKRGKKK